MSKKTYEVALMWLELGISTIPILYRSKAPALNLWRPYMKRLPTKFELKAWFKNTQYNIAVVTGWQGLVIVDFDSHDAIMAAPPMPVTYQVATARGLHFYYYVIEPTQCVKMNGLDIKAAGGYCLATPSIHPNGTWYRERYSNQRWPNIRLIDSIASILPEYQQAIDRPPPRAPASTLHPLDAAMLPHTSTTIEEANDKLDFDQLLARATYGRHYICPFHDDEEPSLKVYPDGHWYCFGCNIGGRDKLDLYAKINGMTIAEALCTL